LDRLSESKPTTVNLTSAFQQTPALFTKMANQIAQVGAINIGDARFIRAGLNPNCYAVEAMAKIWVAGSLTMGIFDCPAAAVMAAGGAVVGFVAWVYFDCDN
jgi:membrane associated rhomboid family serine protease